MYGMQKKDVLEALRKGCNGDISVTYTEVRTSEFMYHTPRMRLNNVPIEYIYHSVQEVYEEYDKVVTECTELREKLLKISALAKEK